MLVSSSDKESVIALPSMEELKNIIFEMDSDNAPGLDDFYGTIL